MKITPDEIEKRRKAVESAIKSHEMEGFEFTNQRWKEEVVFP